MSTLEKATEYFKIPHFFRDIIILMFGLIFLFFLNYFYKPDFSKIPNINYFNDTLKIVFAVSLSYVFGRALLEVADFWINLFYFIFKENSIANIKLYYQYFLSFINNRKNPIIIKSNVIYNHEKYCYLEKNIVLTNVLERKIYANLFSRLALGFFLAATLVSISLIYFAISLILTISCISSALNINSFTNMINVAVIKEEKNLSTSKK
jgi:hypothetical protein